MHFTFHHRHLPTFVREWHRFKAWYIASRPWQKFVVNFAATGAVVYLLYLIFFTAPAGFPQGAYVAVPKGSTLSSIAKDFTERDIIKYSLLFKLSARVLGNERRIPAGVYYFPHPQNVVQIAIRLVSGDFETTPVRVTIPEGATVADIAKILEKKMPSFDYRGFLNAAKGQEGYLFPDTYFFMPGDSTEAILSVFSNGFHTHISKIQAQVTAFKKPLPEIITMASLLEKEAADTQSRRIIAGLLWHRIAIGMPLQVDAVFPYIIGKNSFDLTRKDLKMDHPYNTYVNKGLPPGPIANPGLDSILAAVTPIPNNYVYYLSDLNGNFHFCVTYDCQLANQKKYLSGN